MTIKNESKCEPLWDSGQLAQFCKVSKSHIEKLRAYSPSDLPPAVRIGRSVRYSPDAVRQWVSAQTDNQARGRQDG